MSALLSITRTQRKSMKGCRPPMPQERLAAFREELQMRPDYDPQAHDAKIIRGIAFVTQLQQRPIPKHRALVIIPGPAGALRQGIV